MLLHGKYYCEHFTDFLKQIVKYFHTLAIYLRAKKLGHVELTQCEQVCDLILDLDIRVLRRFRI